HTVVVQEGGFPPFTPDGTNHKPQGLILLNSTNNVDTSGDPKLQFIVQTDNGNLTVTGPKNIAIFTGDGHNAVNLTNTTGNDVVFGAPLGNDTILAGHGRDSIYAGDGNDSLQAGDGNAQLLQAGDGTDTLIGGSGNYDTLIAGSGNHDSLYA